jgi:hypothetical protein
MPESVLDKMETAFDTDFSSVGIHEGEHASAIGSLAFTQGESIHFAPGRYDPSSTSGQSLLGHELAHVVQQRSGRVSSLQGKGTTVNAHPALESEADRAGERAARGESVGNHWTTEGTPDRADSNAELPIQCNLGIEVEVGGMCEWRVHWAKTKYQAAEGGNKQLSDNNNNDDGSNSTHKAKPGLPVPKGVPILLGKGFELQAEEVGQVATLEFVTNKPGMESRDQVESVMKSISDVASELKKRNGTKVVFNASEIRGDARIEITPGWKLEGLMQATVGMPLASIPALYDNLVGLDLEGGKKEMKGAVDAARKDRSALPDIIDRDYPSNELVGFLTLLKHYLDLGTGQETRSFPKGVFTMMARTDFNAMFWMVPEASVLIANLKKWIDLVLDELPRDQPVLGQTFNYDETKKKPSFKIATTRKQWLEDMPERDRLSQGGHQQNIAEDLRVRGDYGKSKFGQFIGKKTTEEWVAPDEKLVKKLRGDIVGLYEGIGAYEDRTDTIKYGNEETSTRAVLIEIRQPPLAGDPMKWTPAALAIFDAMFKAISADPSDPQKSRSFEFVKSDQQNKKLAEVEKTAQKLKDDAESNNNNDNRGARGKEEIPDE